MNRAPLRYGGPWGKLLLIGGISGVVTFPGIYLKHGGVSVEDLKKFPAQLKRKLAVLQWCVIGLLVMMCVLVAGMKILVPDRTELVSALYIDLPEGNLLTQTDK